MNHKHDQITNALIKLYSDGDLKSEEKFREKFETIDWDNEQKKLKNQKIVSKVSFIVIVALLLILIAIVIYGIIIQKMADRILPMMSFGIACIMVTLVFVKSAQRFEMFKLLRELLEKEKPL